MTGIFFLNSLDICDICTHHHQQLLEEKPLLKASLYASLINKRNLMSFDVRCTARSFFRAQNIF